MSSESVENVVDLSGERQRRVHDLNEKRLQDVRSAFISALPLAKTSVKPKSKKSVKVRFIACVTQFFFMRHRG